MSKFHIRTMWGVMCSTRLNAPLMLTIDKWKKLPKDDQCKRCAAESKKSLMFKKAKAA